jgi:Tfp pilus assembly protein PilV
LQNTISLLAIAKYHQRTSHRKKQSVHQPSQKTISAPAIAKTISLLAIARRNQLTSYRKIKSAH